MSRRTLLASLAFGAGAIAAGLPHHTVGARAQGTTNPDGTEPIASGSDLMPQAPVCWRLVSFEAKPEEDAEALARTMSFLMPTSDRTIYVLNETTGETSFLVTHVVTAAFGAQDEVQIRFTQDGAPAPYVAWELIIADEAEDPATIGEATLLDLTEPFTAPADLQEMELVALVLSDGGEAKSVPDMDLSYPMLGYVHGNPLTASRTDGSEELWEVGSTHAVTPGDQLSYAGTEPDANGFFLFPRFTVQRGY